MKRLGQFGYFSIKSITIKSLSLLQTQLGVTLAQLEAKLDRIISEGDTLATMLTCLSKSEIFIKNINI